MYRPITLLMVFLATTLHCYVFGQEKQIAFTVSIPTAGNSWIMSDNDYESSDILTADGVFNWTNQNETIRTFFSLKLV